MILRDLSPFAYCSPPLTNHSIRLRGIFYQSKERRTLMLYIFDKDDNFKNIITEDTGLIDTWFKDYQNHLIDEPFVFHVDSESELLPLIVAENQVAFKHTFNALQQDVETFKLMRIKEIDELYDTDGYIVKVM